MRTKITIELDIVHELPLAVGPQTLCQYIEQDLTGAELLGQRDPKLSVRATLQPELPLPTIVLIQGEVASVAYLTKEARDRIEGHVRELRGIDKVRLSIDSYDIAASVPAVEAEVEQALDSWLP